MIIVTDLRPDMAPIRHQGSRPTCMAFAASDAHSFAHALPMSSLSVEYAHYHASHRMPIYDPHQGTTPDAMFEALRVDGQPPESEWPYLSSLPADLGAYSPPANPNGLLRMPNLRFNQFDEAEAALSKREPVVAVLQLTMAFFRLKDDSILHQDIDNMIRGIHAVVLVGHFSDGTERGFIVRNSWGTTWGSEGYGFISSSYLSTRLLYLGAFHA